MPRLSATKAIARPPVSRPQTARARAKKPAPAQDRLTARTLFFRRVKRSLRPGLWVLAIGGVLVAGTAIFRSIPAIPAVASPAGGIRHGFAVASPAGGIRHGFAALAADAGFRVRQIQIFGANTTPLPLIQAALGVQEGDPILGFSLRAMQARLEQLGPVQTATVERSLPGTLIVDITERSAFAIWQNNAGGAAPNFVLIDAKGQVIAGQDAVAAKRRDPSLLLLAGQDAPQNAQQLITELKTAPAVLARVVAAERVDGLRWNLTLKDQTLVKLPADNEQQAITQLASLQASMALLDRPVEVIDLRLPGRLIVRPYPSAANVPATDASHSQG
jgi:cell division protein FtsQ